MKEEAVVSRKHGKDRVEGAVIERKKVNRHSESVYY